MKVMTFNIKIAILIIQNKLNFLNKLKLTRLEGPNCNFIPLFQRFIDGLQLLHFQSTKCNDGTDYRYGQNIDKRDSIG